MSGSGVLIFTGIIHQGVLKILRGLQLVLYVFCGAGPGSTSAGTVLLRTGSGSYLRAGSASTVSVLFFLCAKGLFSFLV